MNRLKKGKLRIKITLLNAMIVLGTWESLTRRSYIKAQEFNIKYHRDTWCSGMLNPEKPLPNSETVFKMSETCISLMLTIKASLDTFCTFNGNGYGVKKHFKCQKLFWKKLYYESSWNSFMLIMHVNSYKAKERD